MSLIFKRQSGNPELVTWFIRHERRSKATQFWGIIRYLSQIKPGQQDVPVRKSSIRCWDLQAYYRVSNLLRRTNFELNFEAEVINALQKTLNPTVFTQTTSQNTNMVSVIAVELPQTSKEKQKVLANTRCIVITGTATVLVDYSVENVSMCCCLRFVGNKNTNQIIHSRRTVSTTYS
jgi:hypothetical protein